MVILLEFILLDFNKKTVSTKQLIFCMALCTKHPSSHHFLVSLGFTGDIRCPKNLHEIELLIIHDGNMIPSILISRINTEQQLAVFWPRTDRLLLVAILQNNIYWL